MTTLGLFRQAALKVNWVLACDVPGEALAQSQFQDGLDANDS